LNDESLVNLLDDEFKTADNVIIAVDDKKDNNKAKNKNHNNNHNDDNSQTSGQVSPSLDGLAEEESGDLDYDKAAASPNKRRRR
jgi:hypothetical protein